MSRSILVADDSLTVRMDLAEALKAAGLLPVLSATLAEARQNLASRDIEAVILDVQFPDGDGISLLREIRGNPDSADLPVLVLSDASEVEDRVRGLTTGADEYVGKPYDSVYVVSKVRELLRSREPRRDARRTVLVIDDSDTYRHSLASLLAREGFTVLEAQTGEDGLLLAGRERPAAVVVDGVLPGMSGAEVIRRLRLDPALRFTRCVLATGADDASAQLEALDLGADAFVSKNDDIVIAVAKVCAAIRGALAPPAVDTPSLQGPFRILAVDDSPTYIGAVAEILRGEGYDVISAHSGEEAIELLAVQPVDCILLDLVMPGMGGKAACQFIKASPALRSTPLVMLTAVEDSASMLDALRDGADDFISKSARPEVMTARVRAQIRRKQFEDENRRILAKLLQKEMETAAARAANVLAETRATLVDELEKKNKELETFSYSVSHDLKAPLRALNGFCSLLESDYSAFMDARGKDYLHRIKVAATRMAELVDDLLRLSRVSRAELDFKPVDLTRIASEVAEVLARRNGDREVDVRIDPDMSAIADASLIKIVLEDLMDNAWKFTSRTPDASIRVGATTGPGGERTFFVKDNGVGFDSAYAGKLFTPFQRLHTESEFPGTGIGLATVRRIVERHGGAVRAEAAVGAGATLSFTLPGKTPLPL